MDERGNVVKLIYDLYLNSGMGLLLIREHLNADPASYPPPIPPDPRRAIGSWSTSSIWEILRNPKYTGFMVWNRRARKGGNNRINPISEWVWSPVPMHELITCANAYDIGVILYPPSNFNMKHALPNKFFEFVQARLAIAIGPSNAMAPLARRYGFGIVAADFSPGSLAASLNALSLPQLQALKERAHAAAAELCAEKFAGTLIGTVRKALDSARCAA